MPTATTGSTAAQQTLAGARDVEGAIWSVPSVAGAVAASRIRGAP